MDMAINLPIASGAAPVGESAKVVPADKEVNGKRFKEYLQENTGKESGRPSGKIQERFKELLTMPPEMLEKKLEEIMEEFPEELMALLNLTLDYLRQDVSLSVSGYTPDELESFLGSLKDSINDLILRKGNFTGEEETGPGFITGSSFEVELKAPGEKENPVELAAENGETTDGIPVGSDELMVPNLLFPTESGAGDGLENTAQYVIEIEETEGHVIAAMNGEGLRSEEVAGDKKMTSLNGNFPGQERDIQEILQGDPVTGASALAESNHEFVPELKTEQEEFSTGLELFRPGNQLDTQNVDAKDSLANDNANSEGQSAYFMDRSSWIQYIAGPAGKESPQAAKADLESIIEQISSRMQIQRQAGINRIELQLEPESLGRVRLELELENTELTARLLVDNEQVRNYLEQNLDGLRSSLLRQGFNVGEIQIESRELAYQEHYYPQQEYQQQQEGNRRDKKSRNDYLAEEFEPLEAIGETIGLSKFVEDDGTIAGPPRWVHLNYSRHRMNLLA